MVGPLRAVVPFTERAGGVAGGLEAICHRFFVEGHTLLASCDAIDTTARVIAAGEKFRARGRADRANEKAIQRGASTRNRINVGRAQLGVAVARVVAPAGVVGKKDDNVRRTSRTGSVEYAAGRPNKEAKANAEFHANLASLNDSLWGGWRAEVNRLVRRLSWDSPKPKSGASGCNPKPRKISAQPNSPCRDFACAIPIQFSSNPNPSF